MIARDPSPLTTLYRCLRCVGGQRRLGDWIASASAVMLGVGLVLVFGLGSGATIGPAWADDVGVSVDIAPRETPSSGENYAPIPTPPPELPGEPAAPPAEMLPLTGPTVVGVGIIAFALIAIGVATLRARRGARSARAA